LGVVITIWTMYFIAALAASGIFLIAGWRSKQARGVAAMPAQYGMPNDPLWSEADAELPETQADVGAALRTALKRLTPTMASQFVQADIAAPAGLLVRMRGTALSDLLEELIASVIRSAPASRILLTAAAHGERIYIGITDDMPGADAAVRRAGVRGLMERVAMRGGALDVDVRPAEGTTMTLRLPAVRAEAGTPAAEPVTSDPVTREPMTSPATASIPYINSGTSR
jgi:hypothetical protein